MAITKFPVSGEMGYPQQATPERMNVLITEVGNEINICLKKVDRKLIDLNTIFNTGTEGYAESCTNRPAGASDGYFKDYYSPWSVLGYQEYVSYNTGKKFTRYRMNDTWLGWKEVATTDKIDISSYLAGGWVNSNSSIPLIAMITGKKCTIRGMIQNPSVSGESSVVISNCGAVAVNYRGQICQGLLKATTPIYLTSVQGLSQIWIQVTSDRPVTPNAAYVIDLSFDIA